MKNLFKVIAGLLVLALLAAVGLTWWYLGADDVEPPLLPGSLQADSLIHDGLTRSWLAYFPSSVADSPPLVLLLHGSRGDGEQMLQASFYSFNVEAERRGFIVVYPDGFEDHWNGCRGSANYSANTRDIDDVGFLRQLIEKFVEERGADRSRVYVAGLSNGGHMAYRMGLEAPRVVAGIGAIGANLPVPSNLGCDPSGEAVTTLIINGTGDPVNPYAGGLVEIFGETSRGEVVSSHDSARYWARLAGYRDEGEHRVWPERAPDDGTRVESTRWSAPGKPPVALISVIGGGHNLPHPVFRLPRILGRTSHEFDTAAVVWAFFDGQPFIPEGD